MENKYEFWLCFTGIIAISLIVIFGILVNGWINSPTFSFEMDNNTKDAIMSLNDSLDNIEYIPEFIIYNESKCHFITETQEYWCRYYD
jgi:hypothetical protein